MNERYLFWQCNLNTICYFSHASVWAKHVYYYLHILCTLFHVNKGYHYIYYFSYLRTIRVSNIWKTCVGPKRTRSIIIERKKEKNRLLCKHNITNESKLSTKRNIYHLFYFIALSSSNNIDIYLLLYIVSLLSIVLLFVDSIDTHGTSHLIKPTSQNANHSQNYNFSERQLLEMPTSQNANFL